MGWYLRKSLSLGPLRINLFKSGLGVSAGVKGLRVGTGPRGRYLHAGREGLYYRGSLDSGAEPKAQTHVPKVASAELDPALNDVTVVSTEDQMAAARWARINARAEKLGDNGGATERGFLSSFISGLLGGLLRGR